MQAVTPLSQEDDGKALQSGNFRAFMIILPNYDTIPYFWFSC